MFVHDESYLYVYSVEARLSSVVVHGIPYRVIEFAIAISDVSQYNVFRMTSFISI